MQRMGNTRVCKGDGELIATSDYLFVGVKKLIERECEVVRYNV
jgi:hypothetical protein